MCNVDTILIIISILFTMLILVVIYSACVMSSGCNKTMGDYQTDILCEKDKEDRKLTGLENQTLERLLQAYEEDGINFIINDGRVVDYEIE